MIRLAKYDDVQKLCERDKHISRAEMEISVERGRVYIAEDSGEFVGWLRYNLFWDNTPFMNMLYAEERFRGQGWGRKMVEIWEHDMKALGYTAVMTSTQADEYAQHFYMHIGYTAVGGFTPIGDVYELIFMKEI